VLESNKTKQEMTKKKNIIANHIKSLLNLCRIFFPVHLGVTINDQVYIMVTAGIKDSFVQFCVEKQEMKKKT
jgi:hypothetical protein